MVLSASSGEALHSIHAVALQVHMGMQFSEEEVDEMMKEIDNDGESAPPWPSTPATLQFREWRDRLRGVREYDVVSVIRFRTLRSCA